MPPGQGWFPCPRTDNNPTPNWTSAHCQECRQHTTTLTANTDLEPGDEVTVRSSLPLPRYPQHPMAI
eukprot:6247574-Pyramimonas_sp.AAC.1